VLQLLCFLLSCIVYIAIVIRCQAGRKYDKPVLSLRRTVSIPRYLFLVSVGNIFLSGSSSERHHGKRTASRAPQQRLLSARLSYEALTVPLVNAMCNMDELTVTSMKADKVQQIFKN
jgi:hypothetical protein